MLNEAEKLIAKEKRKLYLKEWAVNNRDKVNRKAKRYRDRNIEKVRQTVANYRKIHLEELREKDRNRVRENWRTNAEFRAKVRDAKRNAYNSNAHIKARTKDRNKKWRISEKGRHYSRVYESNRPRTDRYWLKFEDWQQILKAQNNKCAICGIEFSDTIIPQRDHIFPRIKGGFLTKDNTQALCKPCNSRKGSKHE